jgi:predicted Na+-dependent transporter
MTTDGSAVGDEEVPLGQVVMSVLIVVLLMLLLILTGLRITVKDIQTVKSDGKLGIAIVLFFHFIFGPLFCAVLCSLMRLRNDWTMGLMVLSVTPPTVMACVVAYSAGADVALTLASCVTSLASSMLFTPLMFTGGMWFYNLLGGDGSGIELSIELPIAEIVGTMVVLLACAAFGMLCNARLSEQAVDTMTKRLKIPLPFLFVGMMVSFALTPGLAGEAFYHGKDAWKFWLAGSVVHLAPLPATLVVCLLMSKCSSRNFTGHALDAIIVAILRRNPAISMGVAALSFAGSNEVDFDAIFGIIMGSMVAMEVITPPLVCVIRKKRFGLFCKPRETAEPMVTELEVRQAKKQGDSEPEPQP